MVPLQWLSRIVIDNVDFFIHTNKEKATGRIIAKSNFSNQNTLSRGLFRLIIGFPEQSTQCLVIITESLENGYVCDLMKLPFSTFTQPKIKNHLDDFLPKCLEY